ncbi:MAG: 50S ribosomal protein L3 [Fusobacteriota bacterium]
MLGILAKKVGMTQIFEEGKEIPVTVVEVGENVILQKKTEDKDGYTALQLGFDEKKEKNTKDPLKGIFKKAGVKPQRFIKEFKVDSVEEYELGQALKADILEGNEYVDVTGTSKGKGFQGTIKRHNFSKQPATHGAHNVHRKPGSIGQSATPSEVMKGMKMAGRMGGDRVTVQNLKLVKIDLDKNILLVKGAVPGAKNGYIEIKPAIKK